ncbi:MAG: UDP-N-acetylglucosamine 2-epimerase (non-hydrolyzing) [Acidobacteria bacterium]|nr:MAG: UDP-N-acetylglucosamine 2-epimerase (non-hydrolyzing) [Acidobacteriota bacterium]
MIVVGARPNFMKAAPLIAAIREHNQKTLMRPHSDLEVLQEIIVHTGQHYDEGMSGSFFTDLRIPKPNIHLGVGSGSHAQQTAEIMRRFEEVLIQEKPEALIVVGDVNSTVACALVAAKISFDAACTRPLIAHVEAGLRSFDREMPEEVNRVITDHLSDLLFVTEQSGIDNLQNEGIPSERVHFVGNTMIDSLLTFKDQADRSPVLHKLGLGNPAAVAESANSIEPYALLTLHRPSNVDHQETFLSILEGLSDLARTCPIIFSAHPRTRKRILEFGLERFFQHVEANQKSEEIKSVSRRMGIRLLEPQGYIDFLCLMKNATLVLTDSGGIQEETTCLGVPCVTVRENTERPVTVTHGTNIIAGTDKDKIKEAILRQRTRRNKGTVPEKWDGKAGARIIAAMVQHLQTKNFATELSHGSDLTATLR